jgi:hypothetical protein
MRRQSCSSFDATVLGRLTFGDIFRQTYSLARSSLLTILPVSLSKISSDMAGETSMRKTVLLYAIAVDYPRAGVSDVCGLGVLPCTAIDGLQCFWPLETGR